MKYKGEYSPSFLADPVGVLSDKRKLSNKFGQEDFMWHPLQDCIELLDKYRYAAFSEPGHSLAGPDDPGEGEDL